MSTAKRRRRSLPGSKMVVRLWLIMMALVLFSIAFMWVVQIFLFEQNYVDSAMADIQGRLEPVMEDLKTEDLATNDKLLPYLSKSTSGKMMLVNRGGELLAMYSYGYRMDLDVAQAAGTVWHSVKESPEYERVLKGEEYQKTIRNDTKAVSLEFGIPVTYDNQSAYVILYHSLDDVNTVLGINRRQLTWLTVILTLAAAGLAALFSRQFIKPIQTIKGTVNRLAEGDLTATPGLKQKDELGQLSHSVEELGQALQRVDVLRKEVIANVSHELRSPLALIIGYSEMVRDISWKDDGQRMDHMNLIIGEAKRMSEMVNDIMDYSQFQAGYVKLRKDHYNLHDIVESEVTHCEQSALEHRILIRLESGVTDIPVYVDALKISQVMRNLLYNAINHTKDGAVVTVAVEIRRLGEQTRVSVINPGKPIPEEERELIWERYHRSQHQGGRKQGTGLGLSIVSTILKAHSMAYGVECRDGNIVFWFDCPLSPNDSGSGEK